MRKSTTVAETKTLCRFLQIPENILYSTWILESNDGFLQKILDPFLASHNQGMSSSWDSKTARAIKRNNYNTCLLEGHKCPFPIIVMTRSLSLLSSPQTSQHNTFAWASKVHTHACMHGMHECIVHAGICVCRQACTQAQRRGKNERNMLMVTCSCTSNTISI